MSGNPESATASSTRSATRSEVPPTSPVVSPTAMSGCTASPSASGVPPPPAHPHAKNASRAQTGTECFFMRKIHPRHSRLGKQLNRMSSGIITRWRRFSRSLRRSRTRAATSSALAPTRTNSGSLPGAGFQRTASECRTGRGHDGHLPRDAVPVAGSGLRQLVRSVDFNGIHSARDKPGKQFRSPCEIDSCPMDGSYFLASTISLPCGRTRRKPAVPKPWASRYACQRPSIAATSRPLAPGIAYQVHAHLGIRPAKCRDDSSMAIARPCSTRNPFQLHSSDPPTS